jgi:hypothetical protein
MNVEHRTSNIEHRIMNSVYFIKRSSGLLVVGAVCNRDLLGLTYADNRGYKPLPPTINISLIVMLLDVVSYEER